MPSIRKRGNSWIADIRRKGHKSLSKSFPSKALAVAWARKVEQEMDSANYRDRRSLNSITVGELIDRYTGELGKIKPFGKNKASVLAMLKSQLGELPLSELTAERLNQHCKLRREQGAGGVTVGIELTYLGGILKVASALWKMPVNLQVITDARTHLKYVGVSLKSKERSRRPTAAEIAQICGWFDAKPRQKVPMSDIIHFAVATAMRAGEIISLRWEDLNEKDRTIVIRDRKHPTKKHGNDQEVQQVALVSGHRDWKMLQRYTQLKAKDLHRLAA